MLKKEITDFMQKTPPFDLLEIGHLDRIADKISIEFYPRGHMIFKQNGPPCTSLNIIKKGGVKVYTIGHEGDEVIIDYRSEGDAFGYVSLISGDKSRANVLAIEDTICYLIPKETLLQVLNEEPLVGEYFMQSFFLNFIDKTYGEMRNKSVVLGAGDRLLYTTLVKDLITKDAVVARSGIAIQEAARIMSKNRISSLILMDEQDIPVGIITDRDLRDKVVARGLDLSGPVDEIMSPPLVRVDSFETCFEALVKMVQFNIHHLLVVEEGSLRGVVTNHDFMVLQGTSPLSLVKFIENQKNFEGLLTVHEKIDHITAMLFKEGVKASHIIRIITELHDRLLRKIIDLSIKEIGSSPAPFALAVFGSEGRKEQTFKTDFNCAIIFEDTYTPAECKEMEAFSEKLIAWLRDIFAKCGLPRFHAHPLGDKLPLYGDISSWEKTVVPALRSNEGDVALHARSFLDMRSIYGDGLIVKTLKERICARINENRTYLAAFLDWVTNQSSPLGFFKQFVVDRSGDHRDKINIKEKGILPIVDALRVLAVAHSVQELSTLERLYVLSKSGDLLYVMRDDIASAFEFLLHLRLTDQIRKKEFHEDMDDFIEPARLSVLERKTLKDVFQLIPKLQTVVEDIYLKRDAIAI